VEGLIGIFVLWGIEGKATYIIALLKIGGPMPIYDFQCNDCKKEFEVRVSIKEVDSIKCPFCQSKNLNKLISTGVGLKFKGSGFYTTDYKGK